MKFLFFGLRFNLFKYKYNKLDFIIHLHKKINKYICNNIKTKTVFD
jgi:hypothetical protein